MESEYLKHFSVWMPEESINNEKSGPMTTEIHSQNSPTFQQVGGHEILWLRRKKPKNPTNNTIQKSAERSSFYTWQCFLKFYIQNQPTKFEIYELLNFREISCHFQWNSFKKAYLKHFHRFWKSAEASVDSYIFPFRLLYYIHSFNLTLTKIYRFWNTCFNLLCF